MLHSPALSHVSHTQRKSSPRDVKKSFKINILFARDLAFTRPILAVSGGSLSLAVLEARHRGRRFRRFTPRRRGRGEQGFRDWNIPSRPMTGTSQAQTGSNDRQEKQKFGTAPCFLDKGLREYLNEAFSFTRKPALRPRRRHFCRSGGSGTRHR